MKNLNRKTINDTYYKVILPELEKSSTFANSKQKDYA